MALFNQAVGNSLFPKCKYQTYYLSYLLLSNIHAYLRNFVGTLVAPICREWFTSYNRIEHTDECSHCESLEL
jgi:hypothetical protein